MKVSTNLKSGNMLDAAQQAATGLGNQAGGFFSAAERQTADLTGTVAHAVNNLWQGLTSWFGL